MSTFCLALDLPRFEAMLMSSPHDRAINLSFAQAVAALMEACGVPDTGRTAFEARIRHLQRLGVPSRSPDQRMSRIDYGLPELAALATAFRLMAAFMAPALAARYVTERWSELAPFVLAGARDVLPVGYASRRPISEGSVAVFEGNALADLGRNGRGEERHVGRLGHIVIGEPGSVDLVASTRGAGLLLDSRTYMPALFAKAAALALATDADIASELDRLRFTSPIS